MKLSKKDQEESDKNLRAALIFAGIAFILIAFFEVILPIWFSK